MKKGFLNVLLAIALVSIGVLLLLSNLDVISLEMSLSWENIYPVLLLGIGLKMWLDALLKSGGSWILGSFLTILGALLLLDRFEVIVFELGDVLRLWPLLFIYIGFAIFLGGNKRKRNFEFHYDSKADPQNTATFSRKDPKPSRMAIGSQEFKKDNWKVEPMDLWNGIGDYKFDFTRAFIPDGDTPIHVRGWIGDVKMVIPKNVPFRVEASIKTGDIQVNNQNASGFKRELVYETEDYHTATRRLSLYIDFRVGSIKVDHV
ncbi:cell wall-active antibiotics response protein LiaF [Halobacillus mangrovi]|uniref:Cell wall-active antibiotics response LiaF-like C-terminal domain-containing protein n=1 Tax=Halobacillus mangrovi TaxID=402384 RepID=A0A1W5ZXN4_9BACI|nr:cell wall-active antibiotics response protein LiaF [Halobacillus mangrovi]ARI78095.1 hypothetical protein HM131_15095 [Halobacillus mangrovi]